jgi:amino acid adenylation domain-containing protein
MTNQTIAELVSYLKRLDVQLRVEDEMRLRCNAPEGTLTGELRQELSDRKTEIIAYLQTRSIQSEFPLSFAQQRLWFLYQLAPDNPFYNVPAAIRLTGTLDQAALQRSFEEIVRRHAALRTKFAIIEGQPVQVVESAVKVELSIVNLTMTTAREQVIQQLVTSEAQRPFNLMTDSLLRVTVLQFDPKDAVLLLTMHHIVADGWSLGVLIRELAYFYPAFAEGQTPRLPALAMQYTDFAAWQRNWLQGEILERQLSYWRKQLQDLPMLDLPTDRPRPAVHTYRGATYPLQLSPALTQKLVALSQQSGTSLFMTLLAAFQTLLYRYTGQTDIAVGTAIANRHRSEVEDLIGFFVNSLVMRSNLSGEPTFLEVLERVRNVALEAYEHQDLPFEKLVEELDPERNLSHNPLFQVAFALQNAPMQSLELPGLKLEPLPLESGSTRFDLEVHLWEPDHGLSSLWQSQEGLSGFIAYSTDLFDRDRIVRLVSHFQMLLEGIVANPNTQISTLPVLPSAERQQVLAEWNQTQQQHKDRCFHQIFEAQVEATPDAIAVVAEFGSLTHRELNQQADQLAQVLRQMGVQADSLVGLFVDRSIEMMVGILGILKAGGAYVPLDPKYPYDRLNFMLSDTQVAIVLTQSWLVESLPVSTAKILCLDQPLPQCLESDDIPVSTSDQLAYVIYTSGSTGTPKGVLLSHRGLCNVVEAQQQTFHLSRSSRILQFSSLSFDASIFEIALAIGSGGTLYIPPQSAQLPGIELLQFLQENAITHALLTPAVLAVLPFAELPDLKVLMTGGEACSSQTLDRWATNRHFFNAYGPTETTIWATVAELRPGDHPRRIGRPIPNTQIYLLDAHLNPVPIGIPGEIYIGGEGVARGYLNRSELTAERFIQTAHSKLYKTGDRAVYHPDGWLEFLGRVDDQIKLRGLRVELGEIVATMQSHPAIAEATVVASGETSNEMRLIAYFSLDRQQLRQSILESLQAQHLQDWKTLYEQTYQPSIPSQFNHTGWNSSYTGQPISIEQMQEWVSDRVQQILALRPKQVLEIGCGTGLLLFQIAPHCQKYLATDFSSAALNSIQAQLELPQVELLNRTATDFTGIEPASFDVVILNSIVQYFPTVDYLMQVLEGAIKTVAPGGVLFLGDIRSLPLLAAFHSWVHFSQADASLERSQLYAQVQRSQFEEPELAISPTFFYALRDRFPQIQRVQVRLAQGRSQNEMAQFRYNVLLHLDSAQSYPVTTSYPWAETMSISTIQTLLSETKPEHVLITNIPNRRVAAAIKTANWLSQEAAPKTVGQMREILQESVDCAIEPQDWWDLESSLPYTVEITWSTEFQTGNYDVLLLRHGAEQVDFPISQAISVDTNHPLQSQFARQLIPQLRQFLGKSLPDYMIPAAFMPLQRLPLTPNGKVNRRALPAEYPMLQARTGESSDAVTPIESILLEIWQDLLRIKSVTIHDNFFELGGHSLLATQMTSRVRDALDIELPLKSVFEAPTIAQLSSIILTLKNAPSTLKVPPLVRLDRSAYRHTRSVSHGNSSGIQNSSLQDIAKPTTSWSPLVPLTLGKSREPFFCVHPMFGVVFPYLELANLLNSDRSFYGLQPLGLDGKTPPLNRIEAIAAYYIEAIRTLQPQGPYFLGGWSFGGLVAFEMAQQLRQVGQQVELLALLDTPAPGKPLSFRQSLKFLLGTALWSTLPFMLDFTILAANRIQSWYPKLSRWKWSALLPVIPEASRLQLLDESAILPLLRIVYANAQAVSRYVPQHYHDRMILFTAAESPENDPTLGWSGLTTDLRCHSVSGNHLSLLKQPHVQMLAQQLGQYLSD